MHPFGTRLCITPAPRHPRPQCCTLQITHLIQHLQLDTSMLPEQRIIQRNDGNARARIALPRTAAKQLAVNAWRFVIFRENHTQSAALRDTSAEQNIRATPRHVGRNGNRPAHTRVGHDGSLLRILTRVEHLMR